MNACDVGMQRGPFLFLLRHPNFDYFCEMGAGFSAAFFSVARAPARMFTASLLFSLQSYSNIGPVLAVMGIIADHGLAHVDGSSIVNLYSMVSADMRLKYSVIFCESGLPLR